MDKRLLAGIGIALCLAFATAEAHGKRHTKVRVIGVEPIYETVVVEVPVQACRRDYVERRVAGPSVAGPTLAGAVVGAAVGRQFGGGSGRDALTVIGAIAGSAVANERALRRQGTVAVVREPVERCTTRMQRHTERRLAGYWVDYRHRGRIYRILSHERPGSHINVAFGS
jgi:uncharacterized protein YcfJ